MSIKNELKMVSEELERIAELAFNIMDISSENELARIYSRDKIRMLKVRIGQIKFKLTGIKAK